MPTISKGSVLKIDVATVLTAVSEVISIDHEPGNVNAELFLLPANAGHQQITDHLTTPSTTAATQLDGSITFADSASTAWPFKIAGFSLGVSGRLNCNGRRGQGVRWDETVRTSNLRNIRADRES